MSNRISRPALSKRRRPPAKRPVSRVCEVGWLVDSDSASFIYGAPRPLSKRPDSEAALRASNPKGVSVCPAVIDTEAKTFEVPCPVDLHLRLTQNEKGQLNIAAAAGGQSSVNRQHLSRMVFLLQRERWRDPKRPVVQVSAPYRFITDEPVWLNQLPPYDHYRSEAWPGLMIGGRFPIDVWPRSMMWAFEWHDLQRELKIRRGEPWFYVRFETLDPSRPLRLVEAEMTPDLRRFCAGLDGVTNYVNQTMQLFAEARARRPKVLLKRADRRREE